jgi:ABC-2 type transport system permease protein
MAPIPGSRLVAAGCPSAVTARTGRTVPTLLVGAGSVGRTSRCETLPADELPSVSPAHWRRPTSQGWTLSMSNGTRAVAEIPPGHGATAVSDLPMVRVNAPQRFLTGFGAAVREVWQYRELLSGLVRKELKVRYKNSALGFVWSLLLPLVQLAVYWLVIGKFLSAGAIPAYGIFIFSGLAVWTLFNEIVSTSTTSILNNAGLVKKVYFPRELFPLAAVGAAMINFGFQLVILVGAVIVSGINTGTWPDLQYLPLAVLGLVVLLLFATALGLVLAAANVYLRDVQHLIGIVLMLWFWVTPIIYDVNKVARVLPQWLYDIYLLNPVTAVVFSFQKVFWPQGEDSGLAFDGDLTARLGVLAVVCAALLWLAQRVFARAQGNFAQEL